MKTRTSTKRILILMTLVITLIPMSRAQAIEGNWINYTDTEWYNTKPVGVKEYTISTAEELAGLAKIVNTGISTFADTTITLAPNSPIDLSAHNWTPIGIDYNMSFRGFFNGNNNTITGLYIDHSENNAVNVYTGLFGYIYSTKADFTAGVQNLTLQGGKVIGGKGSASYTGALAGLVKVYGSGGVVPKIAITGITSSVAVSGPAGGSFSYTGGIIGYGIGFSSGTVTLSACMNTGPVTGGNTTGSSDTGGIIGYGDGNGNANGNSTFILSGCINTGTVTEGTATDTRTGGIIGYGYSCGNGNAATTGSFTLSDSYNTGEIIVSKGRVGGIAGYIQTNRFDTGNATATIQNCWASGPINGTGTDGTGNAITGGIVGALSQGDTNVDAPVVKNCLAIPASLTGKTDIHRIVGVNGVPPATVNLINNYAYTPFGTWGDKGTGNLDGADWILPVAGSEWTAAGPFTAWTFNNPTVPDSPWLQEPVDNYLPILNGIDIELQPRIAFRLSGTGADLDNAYIIRNRADLDFLSNEVNRGNTFAGQYFKLVPTDGNTLDMGNTHFTPIGNAGNSFRGFFDGNGKTITGLYINHSGNNAAEVYTGLFGYIYSTKDNFTAGVQNLTLQGGEVIGGKGTISSTGALAGRVRADGSGGAAPKIAITGITSSVAVSGSAGGSSSYTGSIIGYGTGFGSGTVTLSACMNTGSVTGRKTTDYSNTGGIIGCGEGNGTVTGDGTFILSGCINTGTIMGGTAFNTRTGGIIGYGTGFGQGSAAATGSVTLSDSYNTGEIIASEGHAGGIAGYMRTYAATGTTATATIQNCWASGPINGTGTTGDGDAITGGIVGALLQGSTNANAPVVKNCLAIPASLTGKTGVALRRIVGEKIDDEGTLINNYAYVSSQPTGWQNVGLNDLDGADWNGLMSSPPVAGYDAAVWQIDDTHKLMPKLKGFAAGIQPDIDNPFMSKEITAKFDTQGGSTISPQPVGFLEKIIKPSPDPTKAGYTLEGWYAEAACTTPFDFSYTVDAFSNDTTLYAKWKRNTFTVALPGIEGVTYDKQHAWQLQVTHGESFTFRPTVAEGYSPITEIKANFGHEVTANADGTYTIKNVTSDVRIYIYGVTKQHTVTLTLDIEDKTLADHVRFYPGPGTYTVNKGKLFQLLAYLDDTCDESDLTVEANGETITAEEKKTELRSIAYTFKVPITEDTHIKIVGVERNATGSLPNPSQGGATVYTTPGNLHIQVKEVKGEDLRIYTLTGQLIDRRPLAEGTTTIPLKKGVYMVAIDNKTVKVIVR